MIPNSEHHFIGGTFNIKNELVTPLRCLSSIIVDLGLQLVLFVDDGDVRAHLSKNLGVTSEFSLNEGQSQKTFAQFHFVFLVSCNLLL